MITRSINLFGIFLFILESGCSSCQTQNRPASDSSEVIVTINDSLYQVRHFYSDGSKKDEFYLNAEGKLHSHYLKWDTKGTLITEWDFENGELHGKQISRWSTGSISCIENYYKGVLHGIKTNYTATGEFISEEVYNMGQLTSRKEAADFYKPLPEMLKIYTDLGLDSVTATKILRDNLSGYIFQTDSGVVVKYDTNVANILNSIKMDVDSIRNNRKGNQIPNPSKKKD